MRAYIQQLIDDRLCCVCKYFTGELSGYCTKKTKVWFSDCLGSCKDWELSNDFKENTNETTTRRI